MRYMLLICGDESVVPTNEQSAEMQSSAMSWVKEMEGRGVRLHGSRLRPVSEATTVRVRDERLTVSDGPFAETMEQMGGYDMIEAKDLVVDRSAFDRIIQAGGYVSAPTGSAPDAASILVPQADAHDAFDAATCIGCGACVAACPNGSGMLF
ncbi:MAG: succinate dehydrogenase subunit, partial [Actinoallomurus sp.]|nr:succinate dehydrogenase subunit [Actinoallomurus sp.]